MDYQFFAALMGVIWGQDSEFFSDNLTLPTYDPDRAFWYSKPYTGTATIGSPWAIPAGEKYVIFVGGDLDIKANITVPNGSFLAFIVSGDITIDPAVTDLQGLYLTDQNFVTESKYVLHVTNDVQLNVQGSVVSWGALSLGRNLGTANSTTPAELFSYRLDLMTNMPQNMKTYLKQWQEVVPGTFGY